MVHNENLRLGFLRHHCVTRFLPRSLIVYSAKIAKISKHVHNYIQVHITISFFDMYDLNS